MNTVTKVLATLALAALLGISALGCFTIRGGDRHDNKGGENHHRTEENRHGK